MNQRPRTIQEQLTRLKEKGMEFNDEQIAISYLARISYFRLKYYWVDMLDNNTGHFVNGTSFNTIIDRYEFDKKLRNILFGSGITYKIHHNSFVGNKYRIMVFG